jgi:hypothetical protein
MLVLKFEEVRVKFEILSSVVASWRFRNFVTLFWGVDPFGGSGGLGFCRLFILI